MSNSTIMNITISMLETNTDNSSEVEALGYHNDTLKMVVGAVLTGASIISMAFTFIVFLAIFKSGQLKQETINVLATWSLVDSTFSLLILGFYVGPQLFFRTYKPDEFNYGMYNHHIGQLLQASIFAGSIFQTIIAINRYVTYGKKKKILKTRTYNVIAICIFLLSIALSYIPSYFLPCCKIYVDYSSYGLQYYAYGYVRIGDRMQGMEMFNYARTYVNLPIYIISTIIPICCYSYVFGHIFWMRTKVMINGNIKGEEIMRSVQFAMIFFFYTCNWFYNELINHFFAQYTLLFAMKTLFILLEATMNAVINAFNRDTRKALLKIWKRKQVSPESKITILQLASPIQEGRKNSNFHKTSYNTSIVVHNNI